MVVNKNLSKLISTLSLRIQTVDQRLIFLKGHFLKLKSIAFALDIYILVYFKGQNGYLPLLLRGVNVRPNPRTRHELDTGFFGLGLGLNGFGS